MRVNNTHGFLTLTRDIFGPRDDEGRPPKDRTWVREVEIDGWEVDWVDDRDWTPKDDLQLLGVIFKNGQNEHQPRVAPSLSVDDLVVLDDGNGRRYFKVDVVGFIRFERHELTRAERLIVDFATSSAGIHAVKMHQFEEAYRYMHDTGVDEEKIEAFRGKCARHG